MMLETNLDPLPVQVALEIHQVRFRKHPASILEGGACPDVRDGQPRWPSFVARPIDPVRPSRIHARGRKHFVLGSEVRGRKAEFTPALLSRGHRSPNAVTASEHLVRLLHFGAAQQLSNPGRVHVAGIHSHLRDDRHGKAEPWPHLREHAHRPLAIPAKVEVVPHIHLHGVDPLVQNLPDEYIRWGLREFQCERFDDHRVDPSGLEQLQLLLQGRQEPGSPIRLEHFSRMGFEGVHYRIPLTCPRACHHGLEDGAVSQVNAVEVSDREHRAFQTRGHRLRPFKNFQCYAPPVRILSRHFLANYLGLFALTLIIALILMTVIEMLVNLDDVIENRDAAGGALAYLLVRVPTLYLRDIIPAASAIAAFLCLAIAARAREITALKTGGIPLFRIALPVLLAAIALSGLALVLNETVLLGVNREFDRLQYPEESVVFDRGSFWYHRDDAFYNAREIDTETGRMEDVRIYKTGPDGRLVETLHAAQATAVSGSRWRVRDATRYRFDPDAPAVAPNAERLGETEIVLAPPGELGLLERSAGTLSMPQILEAIEARRQAGRSSLRYRAILHKRLAEPAAIFVLALLVIPIAIAVERGRSFAAAALVGILLVAGYRALWQLVILASDGGFQTAVAAPWLVVLGFTGLGAALFARAPR